MDPYAADIPESSPLSEVEILLYRQMKRFAIVIALMFRLNRPVGVIELADTLDINQETMRGYLKKLSKLGLVARTGQRYQPWILTVAGRQLILGSNDAPPLLPDAESLLLPLQMLESASADSALKMSASAENPQSNADFQGFSKGIPLGEIGQKINSSAENPRSNGAGQTAESGESALERGKSAVNIKTSAESALKMSASAENPQSNADSQSLIIVVKDSIDLKESLTTITENPELEKSLAGAGVKRNSRTECLFRSAYLTPDHVAAWESKLRAQYGRKYNTRILISLLEGVREGEPPPELNQKDLANLSAQGHAGADEAIRQRYAEWDDP
jgi:DNA-binding MarR family transcriptional regulator